MNGNSARHFIKHPSYIPLSFGKLVGFANDRKLYSMAVGRLYSKEEFISLCSQGNIREALRGFSLQELWSDQNLFSHLLGACCGRKQSLRFAQQLHGFIIGSGAASHRFTANHLIHVYSKLGRLPAVMKIFGSMPRRNVMSYNIVIGGCIQNGEVSVARKLFEEMPDKNVATWNSMITGLTNFHLDEEGLRLFLRMTVEGLRPDEFSLGSALRCCAGLKDISSGRQIHSFVVRSGWENDMVVASSLAHMYMRSGSLEDGERVMKRLPSMNIVSCNTIIAGRAKNGDSEGALGQFCLMKAVGVAPDEVTFVGVISSCSDLASLLQGEQIHAHVVKVGADSVAPVKSSLIGMYSKCGCMEESVKLFSEYNGSDIVVWTSMIAAYGFHGQGENAVKLFEKMVKSGVEPSEVTFLSLLYACSHSGMKDKGVEYFDLMKQKYGFNPDIKHYTCMVDLLGRSGFLDEAEAMIKSMSVPADVVIWKTLLSACKTHKNVEMAERVMEQILTLNPRDSASYVLLSNIRATTARWGDVNEIRRTMREKRVKKEPGISWLELKGQVYQFITGEESNPRYAEIDKFLKELIPRMREAGYTPNLSTILHDMEDEEKENVLAHHSEKLAIAFAIISMPTGVPIRIMKNLRVCDDCHVAIKFISKVVDREIVVRDTSRFHHFRDGDCSCKDYW